MTLTMTRKKCAFSMQMLGQRLTTLLKVCVSKTCLKQNKIAAVRDLVKNHFKPKLSEASASLLFYSTSRKKEEGVQMFMAELRRLAGPSKFGLFVTDLLLGLTMSTSRGRFCLSQMVI